MSNECAQQAVGAALKRLPLGTHLACHPSWPWVLLSDGCHCGRILHATPRHNTSKPCPAPATGMSWRGPTW